MAKFINGTDIVYSCVVIDEKMYNHAKLEMDSSIHGFVVDGLFRPAEDISIICRNDWCLPIVESYKSKYWIIIKEHPGYLSSIMSELLEGTFMVMNYDIWQSSMDRLVAVVTDTDVV